MSLVDHGQASELFSAYFENELPDEERRALEEHMRSCLVCRREYQGFQKTLGALGQLDKMAAPTSFADGVRSSIRRRSRGRFFGPRRLAERVPYELFSIVMLGLILAIYLVLQLAHPSQLKLP